MKLHFIIIIVIYANILLVIKYNFVQQERLNYLNTGHSITLVK